MPKQPTVQQPDDWNKKASHSSSSSAKHQAIQGTMLPQETNSSQAKDSPFSIPTLELPGYEILRELGRGGMGVVYHARDKKLKRDVALKMLLKADFASHEERQRFHQEALSIAQLHHPNIVQVYEIGEYKESPFFTLEFVDGGSLKEKLNNEPMHPDDAAELMEILARGVAYAHACGIVHRDLKPENILLAQLKKEGTKKSRGTRIEKKYGIPKITDFGIAKRLDSTSNQTKSNAMMGTPLYMSPEVAEGNTRGAGPLSDVYTLGVIFYQLLTGEVPFQGDSLLTIIHQVLQTEPTTPRTIDSRIPRDLETICLKCLAKKPEGRYESAEDLADELRRYLDGEPIVARPIGVVRRAFRTIRRNLLITGFITFLLLVMLTATVWIYTKYQDAKEQQEIAQKNEVRAKENEEKAKEQEKLARENAEKAKTQTDLAKETAKKLQVQTEELKRILADKEEERKKAIEAEERSIEQGAIAKKNAQMAREESRKVARLRDVKVFQTASSLFARNEKKTCRELLDGILFENRGWEWHYLHQEKLPQTQTIRISENIEETVAIDPKGERILLGGKDGTVKICELLFRKQRSTNKRHKDRVLCGCFNRQGDQIVSGSRDGEIKIWNPETGEELWAFKAHSSGVTSLKFSSDGTRIASVSSDKTIKVWDAKLGNLLNTLQGHENRITSVEFNHDGDRIVSASADKSIRIWDIKSEKAIYSLIEHSDQVNAIAYSPDGNRIVSGSEDKTVRIWDAKSGSKISTLTGHTSGVTSVIFSPDGKRIVSGSKDKAIKIWDWQSESELITLPLTSTWVKTVLFDLDGKRLIAECADETIKFWHLMIPQEIGTISGNSKSVRSAHFSSDGDRFVTGSEDFSVKIWDMNTGQELFNFNHETLPFSERFGSTGTPQKTTTKVAHIGQVNCVSFSPNGKQIASTSDDKTIKIVDVQSKNVLFTLTGHTQEVNSVSFSPNGNRIISGSNDKSIKIWSLNSGQCLSTFDNHKEGVTSVGFSPDGNRIVSGSRDKTIIIWDAKKSETILILEGHTDWVNSVGFNWDGSRIVSGSKDKTIKIWDTQTGRCLATLEQHKEEVNSVTFSPDGNRIASGSSDHTIKIWDAKMGSELATLKGHTGAVKCVTFSPDGKRIVSGSEDRSIKIWDNPK